MIKILPYQAHWPERFELVKDKILNAISDNILGVDHIGSTSVPGLAAKDIIDIQVTVESLEVPIESKLNQIGFESTDIVNDHCPAGMSLSEDELRKKFYKRSQPEVNLHIRKKGAFNQVYPILFRDYLRSNSVALNSYAEIKKQLAKRFPCDIDAYYDIKDPVCDLILLNALEWAKANKRKSEY